MRDPSAPPRRLRADLPALAGYVLLTLIFTYPFALRLGSGIVGLNVDAEQHLWSFWWMRKAIEVGVNPYYTDWLYYPNGVSLYFFAASRFHALLSVPLQPLFGLIGAYNLLEFLTFVASGYAAYLLARDVVENRAAAFVAGIVFAFAPTQMFHFNVGEPNLRSIEFLPVYTLCLRRWLDGGRVRWLLGATIALVLSSFADWQFAVYLELFTGALLLALLLKRRSRLIAALRDLSIRTAALQALYLAAIAPILLPMLREIGQPGAYMFRRREDTLVHSADLLAFFVPNPNQPLWRDWAHNVLSGITTPGVLVTVVSLSYVALLLAVVAVARDWRRARFWALCGLAFLALALGPELRVQGSPTGILLPYNLLYQISFIRISREPTRYVIISLMCLSVLSAIGAQSLMAALDRLRARSGVPRAAAPARAGALEVKLAPAIAPAAQSENGGAPVGRIARGLPALLIVAALCFELFPGPINLTPPAAAPSFFTDGALNGAGALLEAPDPSNRGMYFQILHGRPTAYGELSRDNPPGPLLEYIRKGLFDDQTDDIVDTLDNWECVASLYGFTHLAIYPNKDGSAPDERQIADERLGPQALLRDTPQGALYRLPASRSDDTCLLLGDGWRDPTPDSQQPTYRWTQQDAVLGLLRRTPGRVRLQFTAHSFAHARHVEVRINGRVLAQVAIGVDPQPASVDLDLPAGVVWLDLHSVELPSLPADYGYDDATPVAIGYARLSVQPR